MGSLVFDCPLCCGKSFPCRKTLKHHLLSLTANLHCPECCQKLDSIGSLADHLENNCVRPPQLSESGDKVIERNNSKTSAEQSDIIIDSKVTRLEVDSSPPNMNTTEEEIQEGHLVSDLNDDINQQSPSRNDASSNDESKEDLIHMTVMKEEDFNEDNVNMEVRLLDDSEEGSVLILSNINGEHILCEENTEQIEDNIESNDVVEDKEEEQIEGDAVEEGQQSEEIYSCNSCGISFTSVVDHIQNFHSDQEVVVEMAQDDEGLLGDMTLLQVLPNEDGEEEGDGEETDDADEAVTSDTKRVIMENGEIVSARQAANATAERWRTPQILNTLHEEQCVDRDGRLYTRKVVQIERFWDSGAIKTEEDLTEETKAESVFEGEEVVTNDEEGTVSRIYYCSRCYTQYGNLTEFETHVCKPLQGKYKCEHCNVSYNNSKSLCAHMKVHKTLKRNNDKWATVKPNSAAPLGPYRCIICDTIFPSNKSLLLHGRMHEPVRQRPVEGPVEYGGGGEGGQVQTTASPCDRFHCGLCDKWIHVGYRKIHEAVHAGIVEYNCDICNRKFHTKENLDMHMNVHTVDKVPRVKTSKLLPYECNYCNRQFARPHEKVKHERIHTGEKPHSCDICGKSFRVSYCLTLHMRTHTGARPYVCAHCGKRFKAHSVYNHHVLTHSNVRAYKCTFCPKAFKTSVQLAGHKNSHTKPFSCTECNRPFASLYAVRVHMETHKRQNNLKYNCIMCGASYARAFALRDHLKAQHNSIQENLYIPEDKVAALSILQKNDDDDVLMEKIDSDNDSNNEIGEMD